jgi:hypothetical protein
MSEKVTAEVKLSPPVLKNFDDHPQFSVLRNEIVMVIGKDLYLMRGEGTPKPYWRKVHLNVPPEEEGNQTLVP